MNLCPHCGQAIKPPSKYRLNSGHVSALFKLREAVRYYNRNKVHIRREMGPGTPFELSRDEWTNFSYLRFFGLAVHADPENPRGGYWLLTSRGADFLNGKIVVPRIVFGKNGHPVSHSNEVVHVDDFRNRIPKEFYERREFTGEPQPIPLPF